MDNGKIGWLGAWGNFFRGASDEYEVDHLQPENRIPQVAEERIPTLNREELENRFDHRKIVLDRNGMEFLALEGNEKPIKHDIRDQLRQTATEFDLLEIEGEQASLLGDSDLALKKFFAILTKDPKHAIANAKIGRVLLQKGEREQALFFIKQAASLDSGVVKQIFKAIIDRMGKVEWHKYLTGFQQHEVRDRLVGATEADLLVVDGEMAYHRKEFALAREKFDAAIELDPLNGFAYSRKAMLLLDERNPQGAMYCLNLALQHEPKAAKTAQTKILEALGQERYEALADDYFSISLLLDLYWDSGSSKIMDKLDAILNQVNLSYNKKNFITNAYRGALKMAREKDQLIQRFVNGAPWVNMLPIEDTVIHTEYYVSDSRAFTGVLDNYFGLLKKVLITCDETKEYQEILDNCFASWDACMEIRSGTLADYFQNALFDEALVINFDEKKNLMQNMGEYLRVFKEIKSREYAKNHPGEYPQVNFKSILWKNQQREQIQNSEDFELNMNKRQLFNNYLAEAGILRRECKKADGSTSRITQREVDAMLDEYVALDLLNN